MTNAALERAESNDDGITAETFAAECRKIAEKEGKDPLHIAFEYWNYVMRHNDRLRDELEEASRDYERNALHDDYVG